MIPANFQLGKYVSLSKLYWTDGEEIRQAVKIKARRDFMEIIKSPQIEAI
jgi:hypothetical protein